MSTPRLIPLFWEGPELVPIELVDPLDVDATGVLTILHTNDLHSSIDARTELGGMARIASTIEAERAAGPTLVVDSGDSVFGGGTWWCAVDAGATSRLLTRAGYDLAAIGNHDLERGPRSLRELLAAGRRLVASNLAFEDEDLQRAIAPAYLVESGGLRIGVLGLTTTMTLRLVPRSALRGVSFIDTQASALRAVAALSPLVHTIVILSHLGFGTEDFSDVHLIPALRHSKVAVILGGHTHEALDPPPVIDGIAACNAGAHGINVNRVTLARTAYGSISIECRLIPQDETVADSQHLLHARAEELARLRPLQEERVQLRARLPGHERESALLMPALRHSGKVASDAIAMVAHLYTLNPLPGSDIVSHLDIMTAYPNAEQLVEIDIQGSLLKELIAFQASARYYFSAQPVWLEHGDVVDDSELDDARTYTVVMSELTAEGGLGWSLLQDRGFEVRPLRMTCAEVVWEYLQRVSETS